MSTNNLPYHSIPQNKLQRKQLTNWSGRDMVCLMITLLGTIAAFVWHPVAGLFTMACLLPLNVRFTYGRIYSEVASELRSSIFESVLGGVIWKADDTDSRFVRLCRRWFARYPVPFSLGTIEANIGDEQHSYGLLHQLGSRNDHLFIAADGADFVTHDVTNMHHAVDQLADATNRVVLQSSLKAGVSYVRILGPADLSSVSRVIARDGNPIIVRPERFELDEDLSAFVDWMTRNSNQLRPAIRKAGGATQWCLIVVTVRRPWWTSRRARKGKLSDKELLDLPIVELGNNMVEAVRGLNLARLSNVRCLGLAELSSAVRASWDVAGIESYYARRASGEIPTDDDQVAAIIAGEGLAAADEALEAWPQKVVAVGKIGKFDYLRLDDNYIGVLRVVELPKMIRVDEFLALQHHLPPGVWFRHAMTGQTVSGRAETQQMVIQESALINAQRAFMGNQVVANPSIASKRGEISAQANALSKSSVGQHFNMFRAVITRSPEELERQLKLTQGAMRGNKFWTEPVDGPARMADAVWSSILGANRF